MEDFTGRLEPTAPEIPVRMDTWGTPTEHIQLEGEPEPVASEGLQGSGELNDGASPAGGDGVRRSPSVTGRDLLLALALFAALAGLLWWARNLLTG